MLGEAKHLLLNDGLVNCRLFSRPGGLRDDKTGRLCDQLQPRGTCDLTRSDK